MAAFTVQVNPITANSALHLQVLQETQVLLAAQGYGFEYRGPTAVKGKGNLITYYLVNKPNFDKDSLSPLKRMQK